MSLNIKNERVHALAREAASRTGLTQTSVIELALERLLAITPEAGADRTRRIDRLLVAIRGQVDAADLRTDDLYDDVGTYR